MKVAPTSSSAVPNRPQGSIGIATDPLTVLQPLKERIDVAVERVDASGVCVRIGADESVENAAVDLVITEVRPIEAKRNVEVDERREPCADGEDLVVCRSMRRARCWCASCSLKKRCA